jgi:hypothetical protein
MKKKILTKYHSEVSKITSSYKLLTDLSQKRGHHGLCDVLRGKDIGSGRSGVGRFSSF